MGKYAGFTSVELTRPKRSYFDKTHDKRLTTRMGRLTPVLVEECIPGDYWKGSTEFLIRLAPLLAPIYDLIFVYVHFFFVPNRILWEDWEEFITGGRLGVGVDPVNAPIPPFFDIGEGIDTISTLSKGSLGDYLGLPDFLTLDPVIDNWYGLNCDLLPFLAYQNIWYEYYRDRNYYDDDVYTFPQPSGQQVGDAYLTALLQLQTRDYLKDRFTSALPFTQRGEEVLMPLAGSGTVTYLDESLVKKFDGTNFDDGNLESAGGKLEGIDLPGTALGRIENIDEVLLTSSSVSINDFRTAYAMQVWLERNAIAGSRYTESIQAHFGLKPQDSRLQRPEYLGGGRVNVRISEVVNTAWSSDGTGTVPAGNLNGHGVQYGNTNSFRYFCPEHGFIMGILSIMNPPTYQQGMSRMWRRRSFLDYPWPTFAKLGEEQVDKAELYASPANLTEDVDTGLLPLFGYQSRYSEWKTSFNSNHGEFKDTFIFWSLTRVFTSSPVLGEDFVKFDDAVQDQIFIVGNEDNFWLWVHNNLSVERALPYFGTPNTLNF